MKTISFTLRQIIVSTVLFVYALLYLFLSYPSEEVTYRVVLVLLCIVICLFPFSHSGENDRPIIILITLFFGLLLCYLDSKLNTSSFTKNMMSSNGNLYYVGMIIQFLLSVGIVSCVIAVSGPRIFEKQKMFTVSDVDQRFGSAVNEFKFTVPINYNHDTQLDTFAKKTKKLKTTYYFNDALTSANFAKATNKLVPGKTYKVKIFPILATVTSDDCMNFLAKQNAILVGGQGVTLLQDQKADEFPVGKYTVSFDQKDALWTDSDGHHRVPSVHRYSDGDWKFILGNFGLDWRAGSCLLCFCDL